MFIVTDIFGKSNVNKEMDIPDWSITVGNPCRVIRTITEADKRKLFHNEEIDDEAWEKIVRE